MSNFAHLRKIGFSGEKWVGIGGKCTCQSFYKFVIELFSPSDDRGKRGVGKWKIKRKIIGSGAACQ